jgi:hypothetical protein
MKPGSIPSTQDACKGLTEIESLFKAQEPAIHEFIMKLEGNPRVYQIAYGYDDHFKFIVDDGFGIMALKAIKRYVRGFGMNRSKISLEEIRTDNNYRNNVDIITWWA